VFVSLALRIVKWACMVVAFAVLSSPRTYGVPDLTRVCMGSQCYEVTQAEHPQQNTAPTPPH
jgi:hypothetical protein